jgi:hypothetical protein
MNKVTKDLIKGLVVEALQEKKAVVSEGKISKSALQQIIKEERKKLQTEGAFKKVFGGAQVTHVEIRDDDAVELEIVLPFENGEVVFDGLEDAITKKVREFAQATAEEPKDYPQDKGYGRGGDEPSERETYLASRGYEAGLKK